MQATKLKLSIICPAYEEEQALPAFHQELLRVVGDLEAEFEIDIIYVDDGSRDGKPVKLYHLDVYRLEGERQLETLGLEELLTPDALVLVEWGEKFKSIRKRATGEIVITSEGGDARKITVTLKE